MPSKFFPLTPGVYDVEIQSLGGNCRTTTVREGLILQSIEPVYHGGSGPRYKMNFIKAERFAQRARPDDPLDCLVRIKEQLPGIHGPVFVGWKDMPVRRMARKISELVKSSSEASAFFAEDNRSYRVVTIAKVTEEKDVRGEYVPRDGLLKLRLKTNTTKRFYFRDRWYNNPGGEEVSLQCSSYEALRGKDLSTMLPQSDHRAVVRMVLPKSEGSPLGALLVEIIKK